jgi:hypothetical protein
MRIQLLNRKGMGDRSASGQATHADTRYGARLQYLSGGPQGSIRWWLCVTSRASSNMVRRYDRTFIVPWTCPWDCPCEAPNRRFRAISRHLATMPAAGERLRTNDAALAGAVRSLGARNSRRSAQPRSTYPVASRSPWWLRGIARASVRSESLPASRPSRRALPWQSGYCERCSCV